jgi:hypothetical protein
VPRRKQRELWASPPSPPGHFPINIFFAEITSHCHGRTGARHRRGRTTRHQRLQLRWWSLSDPPPAPPRGPTIDVFNFGGGRCRTCRQHQLGGPPSTSSTSVVVAAGPAASTPRGPAIDVFNFGGGRCRILPPAPQRRHVIDVFNFSGGRCWTCRQHP